MKPIDFRQRTKLIETMNSKHKVIFTVPMWHNPENGLGISKWEPTLKDIFKILCGGSIWVLIQEGWPVPQGVECRYPFNKAPDKPEEPKQ